MKIINIFNIKENTYSISEYGEITNIITDKKLKSRQDKDGYMIINLKTSDGKTKTFKVHRIVAGMYIENDDFSLYVNHIDGNKANNHISNLEWCTPSENTQHAINTGLLKTKGEQHHFSIFTNDDVHNICKLLEEGRSASIIIKILNLPNTSSVRGAICCIKRGKNWVEISSQYNIKVGDKKYYRSFIYSFEIISKICELIVDGYKNKEIALKVFDENNKKYADLISAIRNNRKYREVSKLYW